MTLIDVYPLLTKRELEQVTSILLHACYREGKEFEVFEPILKIEY